MNEGLQDVEKASGASFVDVAGRALPSHFGNPDDEWAAVRRRCGLLDAGFRALWRLNGGDRVTFLQGMVTNDVSKLAAGEGIYAALLTIQGRIISDLRVLSLDDELWLDVPATHAGVVRESLEKYIIADDVEFAEDAAVVPLIGIEGPQADRIVIGITGESPTVLAPFSHRAVTFDGVAVRIAALRHTGERGYMVFGSPQLAPRLWEHARAAGAEPVGLEALDVLRVEAGIPWMGRDMDESMIVSEIGIESAISYKKGCYLGQEVVERVAARGQVQRRRVGIECDGSSVPAARAQLLHDQKEIGWLSSAVTSPLRGAVIGFGYVRREAWEVGTPLKVIWPQGETTAHVAALPFYTAQS